MDVQILGLVFACLGVAGSVVWFVLLRRGVRAIENSAGDLRAIREQLEAGDPDVS